MHCAETIKGGIATYVNELLPLQLQDQNFEIVHALIPNSQSSHFKLSNPCRLSTFHDKKSRLINSVLITFSALRIIKNEKINLVHLHSTFSGLFLRMAIFFRHHGMVKIVYCPHGWAWDRDASYIFRLITILLECILSRFTHKIVCISNHEFDSALQHLISNSKLTLIRNGINLNYGDNHISDQKELWPTNKLKLLFVGRLDRQKGFDLLIKSMDFFDDDVYLKIVGDAVLGERLRQDYVKNNIDFLGWLTTPEIAMLYKSADILVIPSRWEGFGLVALEGMKYSLPIVASRVGGLAEVIQDGVTGILIEPNSVNGLVNGISLARHSDFKAMGANGRDRLNNYFNIGRVHMELSCMYKQILNFKK